MIGIFQIEEDAFDGALGDPAPVQKTFEFGFVPPKGKIKMYCNRKACCSSLREINMLALFHGIQY